MRSKTKVPQKPERTPNKSVFISAICGKWVLLLLLLFPLTASAHVGSPDFYYDGYAGPYHFLVTVRPPAVIPGIAEIQIRCISAPPDRVKILPLRLVGQGAKLAPTPDQAEHSSSDPQLFIGKLWLMTRGSWKVQINAEGAQGKGELAVPIAAVSAASPQMQKSLGGLLAALGAVLVVGLVGIIRAANRDAVVDPGVEPSPSVRRRAFVITAVATVLILGAVVFGNFWWTADASHTAKLSYKLPHLQLSLKAGNVLQLALQNPNNVMWRQFPSELEDPDRLRLDDLIPDHGHILHLFMVRMPDMTSFWHLHPQQLEGPNFSQSLPSMAAGHYQIYADIVHKTGFPETQVGEIDLPTTAGAAAQGGLNSAKGGAGIHPCIQSTKVSPASAAEATQMGYVPCQLNDDDSGIANLPASENVSQLSDGYRMVWERDSTPLKANQPTWFRFRVEDGNGHPATDLEDYMGMAGHAAFIRDDGQVFAHVHPAGSISMAAAELAQGDGTGAPDKSVVMSAMSHPVPCNLSPVTCSEVSFPYGFPQTGDYHIFVQIKRAGKIETGAFVAKVRN